MTMTYPDARSTGLLQLVVILPTAGVLDPHDVVAQLSARQSVRVLDLFRLIRDEHGAIVVSAVAMAELAEPGAVAAADIELAVNGVALQSAALVAVVELAWAIDLAETLGASVVFVPALQSLRAPRHALVPRTQLPPPVSAMLHRSDDFSLSAELRKLRLMHEHGELSDDEYAEVKARLLESWQ
jgi:hypothetical protein